MPPPSTATPDDLLDQLERLVVRLLGHRFSSARSLWRIQTELLALQRDVQAAITAAKRDRSAESRPRADELRQVMWHARRFGDALAWIFFRNNRRIMYPLSYNAKVPVLPDGHASRGLIAAAEGLAQRLGFPLLHDITDMLRVGDITFFKPGARPRTVEVKTTVKGSTKVGRKTRIEYQVTAIWPAGGEPPAEIPRRPPAQRRPFNARVGRQLERMTRAAALQEAPLGKPTEVDGRKTLILVPKGPPTPDHWPLLRRMIRRARRLGYATAVGDSGVMYVAFFNPDGFKSNEDILGRLPPDLVASGIFCEDVNKNSLWVLGMPDPAQEGPDRYTPYYLFSMPRPWIVDVLRGRLLIFAMFNPGRVAEALEALGFKTERGNGKTYVRVLTEFEAGGAKFLADLPLDEQITEMVLEGRAMSHVTEVALTLANGIRDQMPIMMRDDGLIE